MNTFLPEHFSLAHTDFNFKNQKKIYQGKVRDVYDLGEHLLVITTDRISAFDHILPRPIPYKGQVLNQIAAYFLQDVKDILDTWLIEIPDPNVSYGFKCNPIKIEMVVRGYLSGHAWRVYKEGKRILCGETLPEGLRQDDRFTQPIITPTTKADSGHDEDISLQEIKNRNLVDSGMLDQMVDASLKLFERGTQRALERGLILVDTKYEFGLLNGKLMLMDEIHTPDSSRYFEENSYESNRLNNLAQKQLSKEFVREWLIAHGFQGLEGQLMPEMSDSLVWLISDRYIELYERLTGIQFTKREQPEDLRDRLIKNLTKYLP